MDIGLAFMFGYLAGVIANKLVCQHNSAGDVYDGNTRDDSFQKEAGSEIKEVSDEKGIISLKDFKSSKSS